MLKKIIIGIFILVIAGSCLANKRNSNQPVFDLNRYQKTDMSEMIVELKKNRIILVGEHHSDKRHHAAQLAVIQALVKAGAKVAIGLEMFREDPTLEITVFRSRDDLILELGGEVAEVVAVARNTYDEVPV